MFSPLFVIRHSSFVIRAHLVTFSTCLLVIFLAACSKPPAASARPLAVATIFNYYDALRTIAGPDADTAILLTPPTTPHEYSATPNDKFLVSRAKLLIRNGLGIDDWAKNLASGSDNPNLKQLVIGES